MSIPIVFLFRGDADYLRHALQAARQTNPSQRVVLLGTESNAHYQSLGVEHYFYADYFSDAGRFQRHYVHRSLQPLEFKIFNFQRWFILRDFLKMKGFSRALHLDSDVMLFADIAAAGERFRDYGMTLSHWKPGYRCGHTCFVNDLALLDRFCDFAMEMFRLPENQARLDRFYDPTKDSDISDMYLLGQFAQQFPERIGDLCEIIDNTYFDGRITELAGFAAETRLLKKGLKRIRFIDGLPYGQHSLHLGKIRFASIHFHGSSKFLMKYFAKKRFSPYGKPIVEKFFGKFARFFSSR